MNRSEMRAEIRRLIRDTSTDPASQKVTDETINDRINEIQEEMAQIVGMLTSRGTVDVVAGTREYTLPSWVLAITAANFKDSGGTYLPMTKITENELDLLDSDWRDADTTSDTPGYYYTRRDKIGVYPMPSQSRTSAIQIDIMRRPTALDEDTDIPFENDYRYYSGHMGIVYGVAKICMYDDSKSNDADAFEAKQGFKIKEMLREMSRQNEITRIPNIYESARSGPRRTC